MPSLYCARKAMVALGFTEALLGCSIIAIGIMEQVKKSRLHDLYHGIWGGTVFAIVGIIAFFAGYKKSRFCQILHTIMTVLTLVIICPTLIALFLGEISDDAFYSHWDDPAYCQQGCDVGRTYDNWVDLGSTTTVTPTLLGSIVYKPGCESANWKNFCNPNKSAAKGEALGFLFVIFLFVLCIISAAFCCCAMCRCCGAKEQGFVKPFPVPPPEGYPQTGYGGYGYAPVNPYDRPRGGQVPMYPDNIPKDEYRPPSNYIGDDEDRPVPEPAKPANVSKFQNAAMAAQSGALPDQATIPAKEPAPAMAVAVANATSPADDIPKPDPTPSAEPPAAPEEPPTPVPDEIPEQAIPPPQSMEQLSAAAAGEAATPRPNTPGELD